MLLSIRRTVLLLGVSAAGIVMAASVAIFVDPYGIYGTPAAPGVNVKKPRAYQQVRRAKAARVGRLRVEALLLGNSRVDVGLDPLDPAWPVRPGRVVNAAVPGMWFGDIPRFLDDLALDTTPSLLVVGLEFLDFLDVKPEPDRGKASGTAKKRYRVPERIRGFLETTLSLDALLDSARTVVAQPDPYARDMTPYGFNPSRQFLREFLIEGQFAVSEHRTLGNLRYMVRLAPTLRGTSRSRRAFAALQALLRWARDRGVRLDLVIYPYHAELTEAVDATGLWAAYEDWMRVLVAMVAPVASDGRSPAVRLWDFAGYSPFNTEPIPTPGDTSSHMRWYWEPSHFTAALGHEMLDRMYRGRPAQGSFGVRLSPRNVELDLETIRGEQLRYRSTQFAELARVKALMARLTAAD